MRTYLSGKQMNESSSIISEWLLGKSKQQRAEVLHANSGQAGSSLNMPIEGVLEQFAARILLACADDLGLSTMELSGLLQEPRKDALACLITVIRDDE
ncbi:MAG: hypothetical protein HN568_01655 [Phycisphaerae bacterium]|jgi:hypothetical protein|nr:hypothetical protein [Phycisphaerae bacterium]MBT7657091.1 hypothetical protein [Phycisphaerae bacterium]